MSRPRLYKIREDLNEYYKLVNAHLVPTHIYDHYMDMRPDVFRCLHVFALGFGKLLRIVFLHFFFYQTISYLSPPAHHVFTTHDSRRFRTSSTTSSSSSSSSFNLAYLDWRLALVLIYLNFYHTIVHKLFVHTLVARLIRVFFRPPKTTSSKPPQTTRLNVTLSLVEMLIFALVDLYLVFLLYFKCELSARIVAAILIPHIVFKVS